MMKVIKSAPSGLGQRARHRARADIGRCEAPKSDGIRCNSTVGELVKVGDVKVVLCGTHQRMVMEMLVDGATVGEVHKRLGVK